MRGKRRFNWSPYLLLLPTTIYLLIFFAWPMFSALRLAVTGGGQQLLSLKDAPTEEAEVVGYTNLQSIMAVTEIERVDVTLPNGRTRPAYWYLLEGEDTSGNDITGWAPFSLLELRDDAGNVVGRNDATQVRVRDGDTEQTELTTAHIERMLNDRGFTRALQTTLILLITILPLQFALAIVMALLLQAQLRGNSIFLYIYAIPLGISDLAAGIIWFSIFRERGYINSFLDRLGLIEQPYIFLNFDNRDSWMLLAIILAEVWRATSIVMVIVVSGLQAIPNSYLEAGQVFGANLWQRIRYIVLPLLMPSLQVALILRTILAFQVFAVVIAISGGSAVTVLANETFRWYDPERFGNPNVAAAYAGLIMILSLGISLIYLRLIVSQEEKAKAS